MHQVKMIIFLFITGILLANDAKINGLTFFEYKADAFELSRTYFTYSQNVDEAFSYKFQVDACRENIISAIDTAFNTTSKKSALYIYIKNANLAWKTFGGTLTMGMQGMNMFGTQEKNWGYRFIEKSPMDLYKYSSSADMGISYASSLSMFHYSVMISNGGGYKSPETNNYKKTSVNITFGSAKLGNDNCYNAGLVYSHEPTAIDPTTVTGGFGAYQINGLRVGAEFESESNGNEKTTLMVFYGKYTLGTLDIFGRFDGYEKDQGIWAGFVYHPHKSLSIAPTMRYSKPDGDDDTTVYTVNFQFSI